MDVPAATNGGGGGDANGGLTEEELERQRMRPAEVDADMREMTRRKRVDAILSSKSFKSELERLVDEGVIDGNSVGGCLEHISDMMGLVRGGVSSTQSQQCVQPIADLRGADASQFSKTEKMLRCKLASLFRVIDMHGWAQGVHGHITVRLNQDQDHLLVNPHGLLYSEITASTLIKADLQGSVLHPGSTGLGLSAPAYARLAAVHAARPELRCVLHVQQPAVVAVSALRAGLLPLTEDAAALGAVAVHRPQGADPELRALTADLGAESKVMMVQNAGAICAGETVEEAFFLLGKLVAACENQVRMLPLGLDNLTQLDEEEQRRAYEAARRPPAPATEPASPESPRAAPWRLGELEFEALMRQMDSAGYRTGHVYRHALRGELPPNQSGVEYPPAAVGYALDTDDIFKYSPMRKIVAGARAGERTRWLNSPNVYQKVELVESGSSDSKTVTKVSVVKGDQ
ncbi:protein hu-li tai shao-like isoform X1 [Amphibalanus amphitrite]|uniref:protein hu-li tai shao-like isoform X1 n=2 Tax=Amphibalanus amphitrite TaxID=1232801 RepID=UPI001C90C23C|nr:protein hu-li tai shao-like isoform X1 [Amphibalanus amphitrite]XP_043216942.1 protein hu-li tai shao-like isoform X1 [Amphibalanus amphitrite]